MVNSSSLSVFFLWLNVLPWPLCYYCNEFSHTSCFLCWQVMEKMFEIPVDYWESYLNVDEENIYPNQYNTPQTPDGASK